VERRLIEGTSPFEPIVGFSRAVVAGDRIYVSGTAPIPVDGSPPPEGAYEQAQLCLTLIGTALERAGAGFSNVVRTRIYISDRSHWEGAARAHREAFGEVRPASTMVVAELVDPAFLVEIDAEAVIL
jgi:enamine deaminase RidA (YjgF/YER057c/UK114 family)